MRVAAKLVSVLVLGVMIIVAIEAYVSITRDIAIFDEETEHATSQLGATLKVLVEDVWNHNGQQRALELVEDANREESPVHVRVVRLDAARDDPDAPRASAKTLRMVRDGTLTSVEERNEVGRGFLFTYVRLDVGSGRPMALEISRPLDASDKFRRDTITRACLVGITLTVVSGIAVVVLGMAFIGRPLNRLVEKTRRVGTGDLSGPVVWKRHDEMGELARALNEMCEHLAEVRERLSAETEARIQALQQLRHADRLTTVGRLAAGMAHELGTPLNVASARADMICEETGQSNVADSARIVKTQIDKITKIVRQLLDFARQQESHKAKEDLSELAVRTAEVVASLARKQGVEICVDTLGDTLVMEVDGGQIQQVLTNLMVNAIQAMQKAGTVRVRVQRTTARPPDLQTQKDLTCARIDVHDEGERDFRGPSQSDLRSLFYDQRHWRRHRPGPFHRVWHCARPWRMDGSRKPARQGDLLLSVSPGRRSTMTNRILIVDDDPDMCEVIAARLRRDNLDSQWVTSGEEALAALQTDSFDAVLTDIQMPRMTGIELCQQIVRAPFRHPGDRHDRLRQPGNGHRGDPRGAYDFVTKPVEMDLLMVALKRALDHRDLEQQVKRLHDAVERSQPFETLIGESPVMRQLFDQLRRIAQTDATVLITGESGTGKELVARALHERSSRKGQPFLAVNCSAFPESLLESELFGHEKGAFTDASSARDGLFVQADGGSLLLDEIADLPLSLQPKLLRALEERRVRPIGSNRERSFDVRLLAATNRDLETAKDEGRFREDLYYRLHVIPVELPPLRSRGTDVLLIARHFTEQFAERFGKQSYEDRRRCGQATACLRLARQRPRTAKRDRTGCGIDSIRHDYRGGYAGENPQLPWPAAVHRGQRSVRLTAAGRNGTQVHPARPQCRRRQPHDGGPHPASRPPHSVPQARKLRRAPTNRQLATTATDNLPTPTCASL